MPNLREVKAAIDRLSPEEQAELRAYLNERAATTATMRIDALQEAARVIREGFTDDEWEEVERAMNDEYIEPVDEDGFPIL